MNDLFRSSPVCRGIKQDRYLIKVKTKIPFLLRIILWNVRLLQETVTRFSWSFFFQCNPELSKNRGLRQRGTCTHLHDLELRVLLNHISSESPCRYPRRCVTGPAERFHQVCVYESPTHTWASASERFIIIIIIIITCPSPWSPARDVKQQRLLTSAEAATMETRLHVMMLPITRFIIRQAATRISHVNCFFYFFIETFSKKTITI